MKPEQIVGVVVGSLGSALDLVFRALDQRRAAMMVRTVSPLIQRAYGKAFSKLADDDLGDLEPLEVFDAAQEALDRALDVRLAELREERER